MNLLFAFVLAVLGGVVGGFLCFLGEKLAKVFCRKKLYRFNIYCDGVLVGKFSTDLELSSSILEIKAV